VPVHSAPVPLMTTPGLRPQRRPPLLLRLGDQLPLPSLPPPYYCLGFAGAPLERVPPGRIACYRLLVRQLAAVARRRASRRTASARWREPGLRAAAASCLGKAAASRSHSKVAARQSNAPGLPRLTTTRARKGMGTGGVRRTRLANQRRAAIEETARTRTTCSRRQCFIG
jgi:hypothetical protein